jgi:hypothetical protein
MPTTRPRALATHDGPSDDALSEVLTAVRAVLRSRERIPLAAHGIDLEFDAGVVVVCRRCAVSWRVSRGHYRILSWWSCPRGCAPACPSDPRQG